LSMDEETTAAHGSATIAQLLQDVKCAKDNLVELTRALVRIPTETPTSDTTEAVRLVANELADLRDVEVRTITAKEPIRNLVAKVHGSKPGKRLVLNGHLDTYPVGDADSWSDDPFSANIREGRLYGRGSSDMKGGLACLIYVFRTLAGMRDLWTGELCLTLAGDEETMGVLGSRYLLETCVEARGDAMLNADVGSPKVPRIGEKGMIWIDVRASGRPAHGAHVHMGENAIDILRTAMDALSGLTSLHVNPPQEVAQTINSAKPVSEPLGGAGEAEVLGSITVNFGTIAGGHSANLVPDWAKASADIRLPMGVSVAEIEKEICRCLALRPGIQFDIVRRYEPTWTSPSEPIVDAILDACGTVLGGAPRANMRVGASDARLFRAEGIPSVVCGLTPHNLGGPDEYVDISELVDVTQIHLLAALDYLTNR